MTKKPPVIRIDLDKAKRDTAKRDALLREATNSAGAVARGNREPYERIPPKGSVGKAKGGAIKKGTKMADKAGRALVKKSADTMGRAMKKYASGGLVGGHKSADGIATKGKTKARKVTMAGSTGMKKGGMTKKMKYGGSC